MKLKMSKKLAREIVEEFGRGRSAYVTWLFSNHEKYYRHNAAVVSAMFLAQARRVLSDTRKKGKAR